MRQSEKFILKGNRLKYLDKGEQPIIRISADAYNVLVDMANESGLSIGKVASKAIMYANKNVFYEREE